MVNEIDPPRWHHWASFFYLNNTHGVTGPDANVLQNPHYLGTF